ncbi:hypothetical protein [Oceanobacillus sp. FSL H7-0719]|uniref:hypothetical protein n=1 Tax=Oceanobacillus sp. FSL H7-0719 TaxID=2954507 RepID=UPI0032445154
MKRKYIEMKLAIVEKEIEKLESKENSVSVNLREQKKKQWQLIEQLETLEEINQ